MTLTHKSTHICKHTKPHTKANLQKSVLFLPTLRGHTLPYWTHTLNSLHPDEGRNIMRIEESPRF